MAAALRQLAPGRAGDRRYHPANLTVEEQKKT
jgi:hypothetical protein